MSGKMPKSTKSDIEANTISVLVRVPPDLLKALDNWNAGDFSRPEAIRQLVESALIPKPGAISLSAETQRDITAWAAKHAPGMAMPDIILRLVEIGLKAKK